MSHTYIPSEAVMRLLIYKYLLISLFLISGQVQAQQFTSGHRQTVLIELYTSEGCNSCPPAEEYLNGLKQHPQLWRRYIPIAFHVDYWDYIGWRDPYAHPIHGERQSSYARIHNLRTVYTPAFVINGKAWRPSWFESKLPDSEKMSGDLTVTVNGEQLKAEFVPAKPVAGTLTLNIAVLGMDLVSQILAGENTGRTARHNFVVVGYKSLNSVNAQWKTNLPTLHYTNVRRYALAVWVSRKGDPTPLQAIGGDLQTP